MFSDHIERLRAKVNNVYTLSNLDEWIEKHTYLDSTQFSFKDHEFQRDIVRDKAKTTIIIKCAQVGLSEIAYRYAIAACCTHDNMSVAYTFPTSSDAEKASATRINPLIQASPEVKRLVNPDLNNTEIKQFNSNSFIYFRGTRSGTQALSIPVDILISDEVDASDQDVLTTYLSRLQHKPTKIRKLFSTPTIPHYGVSKEAETAKRYRHISTCEHCNHWFLPDYYEHVHIPDWNKPLSELTKSNIHETRWREATLHCPKCGKDPNLNYKRQQFICENSAEDHEAHAYFVSPFSAPKIITIPYLVEVSTKFSRISEFKNQSLGIIAEEENDSITMNDLDLALIRSDLSSSELHCMGVDMGLTCHATVGRLATDGTFLVVHREKIHYTYLETRVRQLACQYKIVTTVYDSQPYTDLVTRLCKVNPNSWGAVYTNPKSTVLYTVQRQDEELKEGKMDLRLVKINRNPAFDTLLSVIKQHKWQVQSTDQDDEFKMHMTSMKRIQAIDRHGEFTYQWVKSGDETDHYHHALLYLYTAIQLRAMAGSIGSAGLKIPLVTKLRMK